MNIYTKTGDDGTTGLYGGRRIAKDSLRVQAMGSVDELNSQIGLAMVSCDDEQLGSILKELQQDLFTFGANLATPADQQNEAQKQMPRIGEAQGSKLEQYIDQLWAPLEPMKHFVLPGGGLLAARLHVARAVCRRAERDCLALSRTEQINAALLVFLNRLSDLLFAAARRANQIEGIADIPWVP